jgi:hypothetical protein
MALKPVFDELFKWSQEHGFPAKGADKAEAGEKDQATPVRRDQP